MELVAGSRWIKSGEIWHGPTAFRQILAELEDDAQTMAEKFFREFYPRQVVDFYSGIGVSLRRWQKAGWSAQGVELSGEAIEAARLNAPGSTLWTGRVEERLPQLVPGADFVVYTNPPRTGHDSRVNQWLSEKAPLAIAYLSCNVKNLKRDLADLPNYRLEKIQPFDFFPQTDHVEVLALLVHRPKIP